MARYDALRQKLDERLNLAIEHLASGVVTEGNYRYQLGILQGLRDALTLCDEAEADLNQ